MTAWGLGTGLEEKVVVVTGAAQGIGRATVEAFSAAGSRVFAVDRNRDGVLETVAGLDEPERHAAVEFDLRQISALEELVSNAEQQLGSPWALVNVAGALVRQPIEDVTEEDWDLQLDVNVKAGFFLARAVAKRMQTRGSGGRIINFSSAGFMKGAASGSHVYVASKGGVIGMTRALARLYGPAGITVNTVVPGQIDTPMQRVDNPQEIIEAGIRACPLGRMGQPDEVANVAVFLASDYASFVNGAAINVSGGSVLY